MTANELPHLPKVLELLAHDLRWQLLTMLIASDHRVYELVEYIGQPMNLVSYHLKKLRDGNIVTMRRSESDARDVYYSVDLDNLSLRYHEAGGVLHPALGFTAQQPQPLPVSDQTRVLFLCTHNSARSQMAEGLMRALGGTHVAVHSAGSHPTTVHPDAIRTMDGLGIDIRHQQSSHLSQFEGQSFDFVITVCDRVREVCPVFPGGGQSIHWGFPDPVAIADRDERQRMFEQTAQRLKSRIQYFLELLSVATRVQ